jgi:hypothetical protein
VDSVLGTLTLRYPNSLYAFFAVRLRRWRGHFWRRRRDGVHRRKRVSSV